MDYLFWAEPGAVGLMSWRVRTRVEVPEEKVDSLRAASVASTLHAALLRAVHNDGSGVPTAIADGWASANKAVRQAEEREDVREEPFLVGDPGSAGRMAEIESTPGFLGWVIPDVAEAVRAAATGV